MSEQSKRIGQQIIAIMEIKNKIDESFKGWRPSEKLLSRVNKVINSKTEIDLINSLCNVTLEMVMEEQRLKFDKK